MFRRLRAIIGYLLLNGFHMMFSSIHLYLSICIKNILFQFATKFYILSKISYAYKGTFDVKTAYFRSEIRKSCETCARQNLTLLQTLNIYTMKFLIQCIYLLHFNMYIFSFIIILYTVTLNASRLKIRSKHLNKHTNIFVET